MIRKFSSYGAINTNLHFYAPRNELIDKITGQLNGETPESSGHYITVWAPRQSGKTWVMQQVAQKFQEEGKFDAVITTMQAGRSATTAKEVLELLVAKLRHHLNVDFPTIQTWGQLQTLFTPRYLKKPLILMLDEFDALRPEFIHQFANEFRGIYIERQNELGKPLEETNYWLHGLALIGVRSVLGIENAFGSPFNVQRSAHIPNLTQAEVEGIFRWYEQESGQVIEQAVIDRIYYEMKGQPGLTCWLGELLTEAYNTTPNQPLTMKEFNHTFLWALKGLGNNNILNIVGKARQEPYKEVVLSLYKTDKPIEFTFDNPSFNFLYLNGVIDIETAADNLYLKFPSPFVQKRLFHAFANELYSQMDRLYQPFEDVSAIVSDTSLNVPAMLRRYETYFQQNRERLLKDAPRRSTDLRVFEAVYHFNLFMYLARFLETRRGQVTPEFPTGNGQIDILIRYAGQIYGLELKSFVDAYEYKRAIGQAARYAQKLSLPEITLVFFVEAIDEENRRKFELPTVDAQTGVAVRPVFVTTGT